MTAEKVTKELQEIANPLKAKDLARFFKTGKGEYGEGDKFLGVMVPQQRKIAKKYKDLPLKEVEKLLTGKYHEHRLTALLILLYRYPKANNQKEIYTFYLSHTKYINNWDLVDVTTPRIVGQYILDNPKEKKVLYKLVKSKSLWERRIAVLATFMFIKENEFSDSIKLAEVLLNDEHDLIHKAVGWMLREIGKKDQSILEKFLIKYSKKMPRTMLRYAIEKLSDTKRKFYMKN